MVPPLFLVVCQHLVWQLFHGPAEPIEPVFPGDAKVEADRFGFARLSIDPEFFRDPVRSLTGHVMVSDLTQPVVNILDVAGTNCWEYKHGLSLSLWLELIKW